MNMDDTIKKLIREKDFYTGKVKNFENAIAALREVCEHDWEYYANDSHNTTNQCSKCGKFDFRG